MGMEADWIRKGYLLDFLKCKYLLIKLINFCINLPESSNILKQQYQAVL